MSQTVTKQDAGDDSEPAYSFEAIVSADVIDDYLDRVEVIFDDGGECKIHLGEDGIWTRAVDPGQVAMADLSLDASAFESYRAPPSDGNSVLGVNIERLQEMLSVAGKGDLVHLGLNAETRKLDIEFPNVGASFELALIDPDSIRQEPDIPEMDLPVVVTAEASWLARAVKVAGMVGDHVTISSDGDAPEPNLLFTGGGDTDSGTVRLGPEDVIDGTAAGDAESIFSIDYLKPISKVFGSDDEVTMELGEEFPVKMHFEFANGAGDGTFMLAPRIQNR